MNTHNLKTARLEAGFTQKGLGSAIGISRETVVAIENNSIGSVAALRLEVVKNWLDACRAGNGNERIANVTHDAIKADLIKYFQL